MNGSKYIVDQNGERRAGCFGNAIRYGVGGGIIACQLVDGGGQGTLAIGQMIAKAAMDEGKEVTWLPSYGPEMRGGTANCTVIVSDESVGSPIVADPDIVAAMNLPSFDKYENAVKAGGYIFADSTLYSLSLPQRDTMRGRSWLLKNRLFQPWPWRPCCQWHRQCFRLGR